MRSAWKPPAPGDIVWCHFLEAPAPGPGPKPRPALVLAGLSFDTKFDLKVVLELPWTEDFFKEPPRAPYGQTPKLGVLHPSLVRAAKAAFDAAARR